MQIIQKVAIKKKDKLLILLRSRSDDRAPLHWDFPGGKLEDGEDAISGIKRETQEETNLVIGNCKLSGEYTIKIGNAFYLFKVYDADFVSDENNIKLSVEHEDYKWETRGEIAKLKINPFLNHYLNIPFDKDETNT